MTSPLDTFTEDLRLALGRRDRDRRSWLARPTQQAEADTRWWDAARKAAEKLRLAEQVAGQKRLDAALAAAQSDEKLIRGLRAELALANADRKGAHVTNVALAADLEQARHTIAELQGQMATATQGLGGEPLPQRVRVAPDAAPEVTLEAPAPPVTAPGATQTAKPTRSRTASGSARSKPAARRTAPRQPTTEG